MSLALVCIIQQTKMERFTDYTTIASIKNASSIVAKDILTYYHGLDQGQTPGVFEKPYYWWESGAVWGSLVDYWNYTGDAQYVALVQQALLSQVGPDNDYMVPNQTKTEVARSSFLEDICERKLTAMANKGK